MVHISFAIVFLIMVLLFKAFNDKSIIQFIIKFAGITYGPLLGLFAFGILTKRKLNEKLIWAVCIAGPLLTILIDMLCSPAYYESKLKVNLGLTELSRTVFNGYVIGPELILINGMLTFTGLLLISRKNESQEHTLQPA